MKFTQLEVLRSQLDQRLKVSHPGDIQLQISDKCTLSYAQPHGITLGKEENTALNSMLFSFNYHGEHIDTILTKEHEYYSIAYSEGNLLDSLENDLLDNSEGLEILAAVWDAVENWVQPSLNKF